MEYKIGRIFKTKDGLEVKFLGYATEKLGTDDGLVTVMRILREKDILWYTMEGKHYYAVYPSLIMDAPKFAVGQVWRLRNGEYTAITRIADRFIHDDARPCCWYLNGRGNTNGAPHELDLMELVVPIPSKEVVNEGFNPPPVEDCECHKEKFGFMTHEKWCSKFVDFRTMMNSVEAPPILPDYKTKSDECGVMEETIIETHKLLSKQNIFVKGKIYCPSWGVT